MVTALFRLVTLPVWRVTVLVVPPLPTAVTTEPTGKSSAVPMAMVLNPDPPFICSNERSSAASVPTTWAVKDLPDRTTRTVTAPAPWRIWALVATMPEDVRTTPSPREDPAGDTMCTSPGAVASRMLAWLSAPVPSSSSTNCLFAGGGEGIAEETPAELDEVITWTTAPIPRPIAMPRALPTTHATSLRRPRAFGRGRPGGLRGAWPLLGRGRAGALGGAWPLRGRASRRSASGGPVSRASASGGSALWWPSVPSPISSGGACPLLPIALFRIAVLLARKQRCCGRQRQYAEPADPCPADRGLRADVDWCGGPRTSWGHRTMERPLTRLAIWVTSRFAGLLLGP